MTAPFLTALREGVRDLSPAYFALVMATGIVSIAADSASFGAVARGLFGLNVAAYLIIWLLTILRVVWYFDRVSSDLIHHCTGPAFFTGVAATCILGTQFYLIGGNDRVAFLLLILGIVLWILLTYTIFTGLVVTPNKPSLAEGINGAWLISVVATQSIVVLSARLSPLLGLYRLPTNFFALSMWLFGGMLYIWMISLIFYRYTFFKFSPQDLTPPYWVNMGAMAISALGGDVLILNTADAPFLRELLPFLRGFTIFYWATGTWWIPMLVILAVWRYAVKRTPLAYDPLYWGAVFPIGMYAVATFQMADAMGLRFLHVIPDYLTYVALFLWLVTFAGLLRRLSGRLATARAELGGHHAQFEREDTPPRPPSP